MKELRRTTKGDPTSDRGPLTQSATEIEGCSEWNQLTYHEKLHLRIRERHDFEGRSFSIRTTTVSRYLQILFCLCFKRGPANAETRLANSLFATDYTRQQWLRRSILTGNRLGDLSEIHQLSSRIETPSVSTKISPHLECLQQNLFWMDNQQIVIRSHEYKLDDERVTHYLRLSKHARITVPVAFSVLIEALGQRLSNNTATPIDKHAFVALVQSLARRLEMLIGPVLDQDYNVWQHMEKQLQNIGLKDKASSTDHLRYEEAMMRSCLIPLQSRFPRLSRQLYCSITNFKNHIGLLLNRVECDRRRLQEAFSISRDAKINWINPYAGDEHQGGQATTLIHFTDGSKVVYKPRDLGIDQQFNKLLSELNTKLGSMHFRVLTSLPVGASYGYQEFVEAESCQNEDELSDFYFNLGILLGILHALGASDCHHGNLIAAKRYPVLVDTEALFHRGAGTWLISDNGINLANSILSIGILPQYRSIRRKNRVHGWLDGGVLLRSFATPKNSSDQRKPEAPILDTHSHPNFKDDQPEHPCLPRPRHEIASKIELMQERVSAGWNLFYDILPETTLTRRRIRQLFHGHHRRIIFRPTRLYASLLDRLSSPAQLEDPVLASRELEKLFKVAFDGGNFSLRLLKLSHSEVVQTSIGDIPYFETRTGSRFISLKGVGQVPNGQHSTTLRTAQRRLGRNLKLQKESQARLISASLEMITDKRSLQTDTVATQSMRTEYETDETKRVSPDTLRADRELLCRRIAQHLCRFQLDPRNKTNRWLYFESSDHLEGSDSGSLKASLSTYSGSTGIGVFLAAFAAANRQTKLGQSCKSLAVGILNELARTLKAQFKSFRFKDTAQQPPNIGLSGLGGGILICLVIDKLLANQIQSKTPIKGLVRKYLRLLRSVDSDVQTPCDVMSGIAGAVAILTTCSISTSGETRFQCRQRLISLCDSLVDRQNTKGSWESDKHPGGLTGFSHGTSGILAAIGKAYELTGEPKHLDSIERGLAFEESTYSLHAQDWIDLRTVDQPTTGYGRSWCHGAPGIALSRLLLQRPVQDDSLIGPSLDQSLKNLIKHPAMVDSWCCGNSGRAVILRYAAGLCPERHEELLGAADTIEAHMINHHQRRGYFRLIELTDRYLTNPGLWDGLAGIGLALLFDEQPGTCQAIITAGLSEDLRS